LLLGRQTPLDFREQLEFVFGLLRVMQFLVNLPQRLVRSSKIGIQLNRFLEVGNGGLGLALRRALARQCRPEGRRQVV